MIRLNKSAEPAELIQHRVSGGAWNSWSGLPKQAMRALISTDQSKRCAYCENKLPQDFVTDHFHPQSKPDCDAGSLPDDDSWSLTWMNLFAVCDRGSPERGSPEKGCSAEKGDKDICKLAYHPLELPEGSFTVDLETGELVPSDAANARSASTVSTLKLNRPALKTLRLTLIETIAEQQQVEGLSLGDLLDLYGSVSQPFPTSVRSIIGKA